jgi:hypothetical protein
MLPFDRVRAVAAVVGIVIVGLAATASARDATRDFPNGKFCPVHAPGPVEDDANPFSFRAPDKSALLTFATCYGRSALDEFGFPQSYFLKVAIDDLIVVERSVFNDPKNRKDYTDDDGQPCYSGDTGVQVLNVFDDNRRYLKAAVPFREDFEGSRLDVWRFDNAAPGQSVNETDRSLQMSGPGLPDGACSVATVKVNHLVPGRYYVVDFVWRVDGLDVTPAPALSFFASRVPRGW